MTISQGDTLPEATFIVMGEGGPEEVSLSDKTKGRKVVIFAVPGAFTPTCHSAHVPSFIRVKDALKDKGVEEIICVAVNDPFIMQTWGKASGASDAGITMLSDAESTFTKAVGMNFSAPPVGFVDRSKRYAMLVDDGTVSLYVGTQSNGQGHETVYASFLADHSGIPVEAIRIIQGDSDLIATGGGTGGSRSVTMQSGATLQTVGTIVERFSAYLGEKFDARDVEFDDERFRLSGSNETPTMLEVAEMARVDGRSDLLDIQEQFRLSDRSFPNGAHIAEVEIDPETGQVTVDRYSVTDDFGNMINPMLAEGQVHGGVAQ
ncbi:MAG: molybdopterin cofactor-binding domain-containing protein, partial [Pseudomonadota bacterium]